MPKDNLSSLGSLMGGSLARHGIMGRVMAAQIVTTTNALLDELIPPAARGDVQAISYKNQELLIACKTAPARYLLQGLSKTIGSRLEQTYPSQTIKTIACKLRPVGTDEQEWYNGLTT